MKINLDIPSNQQRIVIVPKNNLPQVPIRISLNNTNSVSVNSLKLTEINRDWSSPHKILESIFNKAKPISNKDKVLSIFQYCCENNYSEAYRSTWDIFFLWKGFNCYGLGNCDFNSRMFCSLCNLAGFQANEIGVNGVHTMSEILYDGSWHLFDTFFRVYYLDRDNENICSWDTLRNNLDLVYRCGFIGRYDDRATWKNKIPTYTIKPYNTNNEPWPSDPNYLLTLRPNENYSFYKNGGLDFFDNRTNYASIGCPHSKITLTTSLPNVNKWKLESADGGNHRHSKILFNDLDGQWIIGSNNSAILKDNKNSSYSIDIVSSYPICSGKMDINFKLTGQSSLKLIGERFTYPYQSKVLNEWNTPNDYVISFDLKQFITDITRQFSTYSYRLKFNATSFNGEVIINSIKINSNSQVAFNSIPKMFDSDWVFSSVGNCSNNLNLEIEYENENLNAPQITCGDLIYIKNSEDNQDLTWDGTGSIIRSDSVYPNSYYELQLSYYEDFKWTLYPISNLMINRTNNYFSIDLSMLSKDRRYVYWRVREVLSYIDSKFSPWSSTGTIKIDWIGFN